MKTITPTIKKIEDILDTGKFELVSFGLAPNPWGFCFERDEEASKLEARRLSKLLDGLSDEETNYLKENYL
jgi:hypothetical protein